MNNVSVNKFLIQRNYFVDLESIENTGFANDNFLNKFLIQRNFLKNLIQRNFSSQCFQVFKKILELNYIYNYIQIIFLYDISKYITITKQEGK